MGHLGCAYYRDTCGIASVRPRYLVLRDTPSCKGLPSLWLSACGMGLSVLESEGKGHRQEQRQLLIWLDFDFKTRVCSISQ